ncbi:MAG: hypothetical protein WCW26_02225, partial [Candidatus Buchananbacteria bacterium]
MKIKLPKLKIFQLFLSLKYVYSLVAIIILLVSAALGSFLYKNVYQTITQSNEIILLRQEVAPDRINMAKVNSVLESFDKKISGLVETDWSKI